MKVYFLLATCIMLFSCSGTEQENPKNDVEKNKTSLSERLVGEWTNTYLKVTMPTYNNTDSTYVIEVTEDSWEEKMKIKAIRTFYRSNNTYNSEHRNLKDSIIYNPAGKWNIIGDSITMTDTFPKAGLSYKYKIAFRDSIAEFSGIEDFDQDGISDDVYFGRQRKH